MALKDELIKKQAQLEQLKEQRFIDKVKSIFQPLLFDVTNSVNTIVKTFNERFERLGNGIQEQHKQVIEKIDSKTNDDVKNQIKSLEEVIKKKDFRGPKGDKGDTPVKNIDYFDGKDAREILTVGKEPPTNPRKGDIWCQD